MTVSSGLWRHHATLSPALIQLETYSREMSSYLQAVFACLWL